MEEESACIREGGARNCSVIGHWMQNMMPVAVADVACAIRMERKNGKSGINRWWGQQPSWVVRAGKKVVEGQAGGVGRKDGADVGCGEGTVVGGGPRAHCRQSRAVPKMTTSVAEYSTCWWTDE